MEYKIIEGINSILNLVNIVKENDIDIEQEIKSRVSNLLWELEDTQIVFDENNAKILIKDNGKEYEIKVTKTFNSK